MSWRPFARNRRLLWRLHNLARTYSTRPSAILEVDDAYLAYQIDLACATWGIHVENRLHERDSRGRPRYTLEALLRDPEAPAPAGGTPPGGKWGNWQALAALTGQGRS